MINPMKPKHHRDTEAQRINFRVFRVFRGWLSFLLSSSVPPDYRLQTPASLAVLALFAFLLAAAPACAQTTITLLDIKSPATADPPSTSLLTVSDAGDLWIKGALVEYAYPGLITLDPSRQYWTLRDSDGNILWALEVYSPSTGVSTGNLHAACTFESYCYNAEQDDAIFTCRTASGEAVYTVSAARRAKAKGNNQTQTQAQDFHGPPASYTPPTPDAYAPAPNFLPDLDPYLTQQYWGTYLYIPQAQARIYCDSQEYDLQAHDVTNMAWRRKLSADITTLEGYGVRYGLRCTDAEDLYWDFWWGEPPVTPQWLWSTVSGSTGLLEYDVGICDDGYGGTNWWPVMEGGPYWSLFSCSPTTLTAQEYAARIPVQYVLQNTISDAGNDGQVTATSDLFLYTVHFHHPAAGSFSRNVEDTRKVNVGCCLMPANIPAAWINRIELTLWDPADPSHRRVFKNTESECTRASFVGKPFISKMWDGKLWTTEDGKPDPQNPNDFYYTQASDFFMSATVYWNVSDPQKPWESDSDEYQEPRCAIVAWSGSGYGAYPVSSCRTNFAWINAGDATTSPSMPALSTYLDTNGDYVLPTTGNWKLTITFPRSERGAGSKDTTDYPTSGTTPVAGDQSWSPGFGADTRGLRGGEAVFTCALTTTQTLTHKVHIRGLNPIPDAIAESYINAHCGNHWYARPIALKESYVPMNAETPSKPEYFTSGTLILGAIYNQFYPRHYLSRLPDANPHLPDPPASSMTIVPGNPIHHHDDSGSVGYGMMQITNPAATPQQVWDWRANVLRGIERLDTCRLCDDQTTQTHQDCQLCSWGWVARQRNQMHAYQSGLTPPQPDLPIPTKKYGNVRFGDEQGRSNPIDACTIQAYNGVFGGWTLRWREAPYNCWDWRDQEFTTQGVPTNNIQYIIDVCSRL